MGTVISVTSKIRLCAYDSFRTKRFNWSQSLGLLGRSVPKKEGGKRRGYKIFLSIFSFTTLHLTSFITELVYRDYILQQKYV